MRGVPMEIMQINTNVLWFEVLMWAPILALAGIIWGMVNKRVKTLEDRVDARTQWIEAHLQRREAESDDTKERINGAIHALTTQVVSLGAKMDGLTENIKNLQVRMDKLLGNGELAQIKTSVVVLEKAVSEIRKEIDPMIGRGDT